MFLSFGYTYSHLWRVGHTGLLAAVTNLGSFQNFGIVIAFAIFFITLLLIFTEFNTSLAGATSVILFKQGSDPLNTENAIATDANSDEEKTRIASSSRSESDALRENKVDVRKALEHQPRMKSTFTWQHMYYEVAGRRLLNDVSGYVAPGKLTALMGESGAGKVCGRDPRYALLEAHLSFASKTTLLNVLAERTETGVVWGTRLVNGHPLPRDFQSQTCVTRAVFNEVMLTEAFVQRLLPANRYTLGDNDGQRGITFLCKATAAI